MEREQNRTHLLALFLLFGFVCCVCVACLKPNTNLTHTKRASLRASRLSSCFETLAQQLISAFSLAKIVQVIDLLRVPTNKRELTHLTIPTHNEQSLISTS